jgi:hypothetical protein
MFSYAKIVDYIEIFKFVVNQLYIFVYSKLLYLIRGIYIRFIRQQERHSFSVSIFGSYMRWGITVLHTKLR